MKTIQAKHYHKGRLRPVRLIVIHDMEWPERPTTAEDCAHMFATMTRQASAHVCADNNSAVRCVADSDTAWAAPGANADGLQLEMAGFARQTRAQWLDAYSTAMLGQAAKVVAAWCKKYGIPVRRLGRAELLGGKKGIIGHVDATKAYGGSHTDPGPGFPWTEFLSMVRAELDDKPTPKPKPAPAPVKVVWKDGIPAFPGRVLQLADPMLQGEDVKVWQAKMAKRGWTIDVDGAYGPQSRGVCRSYQHATGLEPTGKVDGPTWEMTWSWRPPAAAE